MKRQLTIEVIFVEPDQQDTLRDELEIQQRLLDRRRRLGIELIY